MEKVQSGCDAADVESVEAVGVEDAGGWVMPPSSSTGRYAAGVGDGSDPVARIVAAVAKAGEAYPAPAFEPDGDEVAVVEVMRSGAPAWLNLDAFGELGRYGQLCAQVRRDAWALMGPMRELLEVWAEVERIDAGHWSIVASGGEDGPIEHLHELSGYSSAWGMVRALNDLVNEFASLDVVMS